MFACCCFGFSVVLSEPDHLATGSLATFSRPYPWHNKEAHERDDGEEGESTLLDPCRLLFSLNVSLLECHHHLPPFFQRQKQASSSSFKYIQLKSSINLSSFFLRFSAAAHTHAVRCAVC